MFHNLFLCYLVTLMSKKFTSILLSLILLALPNHCVFEEAFVSLKKSIFKIERPNHLDNHFGSTSPHQHDNDAEPHQHGEPHPIAVISSGNNISSLAKIVIIPFTGLLLPSRSLTEIKDSLAKFTMVSTWSFQSISLDTQALLKTLKIAAQAPPAIL